MGVGSSYHPPPHISRERLKPHVWRPYADRWKDVPCKQHEAEPVAWPHLWSLTRAPAPRASHCQPLPTPDAGSWMLRLRAPARERATQKAAGARGQQRQLLLSLWVDGKREGQTVGAGCSPTSLGPPSHCLWRLGSCPHLALSPSTLCSLCGLLLCIF